MKDERKEWVLNEQQKKAVEFGDGPLLIIAGAGTGKTTVVTERIKYLIASGRAKPQEILALTFTEKASREMEERIDMALPYGVTQMWISTFHSFCDRILRNEGLTVGLDPNFKLMTEAETIQFFRTNIFAFDLSYFRPLGNPTKFISGMIQHFSRLKDEDITPGQYLDWVKNKRLLMNDEKKEEYEELEKYQELADAYRTYEELKTKHGVMDYGDLITNTLKIFRTRKAVLKKYQEQFTYLLVDEFQDTNVSQNELAILLAGAKKNITVVGDDDQAIYRWRGAAISNIIQFRKRFKKAHVVVLTKNYRSTKEILDSSYRLIQNNNPDRLEAVEKIDKHLECMRRINGEPVDFLFCDRVENEAKETADHIKHLVSKEKKKNGTPYQWKDVAILVRANAHAEPFVRALARGGIPYQFLGPGQLFRQAEVKDLMCYLKVLYDIHDNVSLFRVLSMDHFAIPPRDVAALFSYARSKGLSLFEACETVMNESRDQTAVRVSEAGAKKITSLLAIILRHLGLIKKETAGQILYFFLEDSGLLQTFISYKTEKEERVVQNIAKFFDKLKTYEASHEDVSIFAVVDWLDLSMTLGESPLASNSDWSTYNAVNILTVHSAKGLEFPIVFLVNLVGARFPTNEKHEQIPIPDELVKEILPEGDFHLEEERRLFYVGMTRARDRLFFTAAKYYGEGKREKKVSPFVYEVFGKEKIELLLSQTSADVAGDEKQLFLLDWKKLDEPAVQSMQTPVSYLSYSQMESFLRCPLQYKYRYILKIPVPPSAALSFGDTIHRTLQKFYEMKRKKTLKALLLLYEQEWKSVGYKDKVYEAKMKDHGIELLKGFFEKGFDPGIRVLSLEQPFRIRLNNHLALGGKIDRVDRTKEGKLEIIDYKTGSSPKKRNVLSDKQLSVYALAASEKGLYGEDPKNVIVSFYFLEDQEKISATRTRNQLEEVKKSIVETADTISKSTFPPTPGKHCDFCEFRLICEAWR